MSATRTTAGTVRLWLTNKGSDHQHEYRFLDNEVAASPGLLALTRQLLVTTIIRFSIGWLSRDSLAFLQPSIEVAPEDGLYLETIPS